jgi:hypothetical protein
MLADMHTSPFSVSSVVQNFEEHNVSNLTVSESSIEVVCPGEGEKSQEKRLLHRLGHK